MRIPVSSTTPLWAIIYRLQTCAEDSYLRLHDCLTRLTLVSVIMKLAGRGNGERRRKREGLGMRLVPVLWQEVSAKIPVRNTSATRKLGVGTVPLTLSYKCVCTVSSCWVIPLRQGEYPPDPGHIHYIPSKSLVTRTEYQPLGFKTFTHNPKLWQYKSLFTLLNTTTRNVHKV